MTTGTTPAVLVAAGVDPGGGAGLGVDVAFLAHLGVRAATVVTALTVQDDAGVRRVDPVDPVLFEEQLDAALGALGAAVRAIKTGLVVRAAHADAIARRAAARGIPLVVDPILASGTGDVFMAGDPRIVIAPLVGAATLLTPNASEAAALAGRRWDGTKDGLLDLARALATDTRTVAVTGGELPGTVIPVAVAGPEGEAVLDQPRAERGRTHGTGCAFASSAAGLIARGRSPSEAALAAHRLIAAAVARAAGIPGVRLTPEPWAGRGLP